jgi:uracil-DNA glycosylase
VINAPTKPEVKACSPRVEELVKTIDPRLIVLLGRVAAQTISSLPNVDLVYLTHPSAILRNGSKSIDIKRFTLTLQQALSNLQ